MATWFLHRKPTVIELQQHVPCRFGIGIFNCGSLAPSTPAEELLRHWLSQEALSPGDILFMDGGVLQLSLQRGEA